jgi:DNA-directed RNA polymerase subunit delta
MDENDPELHINVPGGAHAEDEPDTEGYDDAQRAEIAEVEGGGRSDGTLMTDMAPDMGGGDIDEDEIEDDEDDLDTIIDTSR